MQLFVFKRSWLASEARHKISEQHELQIDKVNPLVGLNYTKDLWKLLCLYPLSDVNEPGLGSQLHS